MKKGYRKLSLTVIFLVLALLAGLGIIDDVGREYTDRGFKRALVTFAVARSLNGVISVAQGTEVAIQPAGIGINFTPGQILDPINDLIERFSWVMLASSTSLGIQKLMMVIFISPAYTLLLISVLCLLIVMLWTPGRAVSWGTSFVLKLAAFLFVLRFAVPGVAFIGEGVFKLFLEEQYVASTEQIEKAAKEIGMINQSAEESLPGLPDETLIEKAKRLYENATTRMDMSDYIERYKAAASEASEHAVNLIVIFVFQTMLIPLLFLWVIVNGFRRLISQQWLVEVGK